MTTATRTERNRHDERHKEDAQQQLITSHELMTKRQLAEFLQCSQRQVELLTANGRLPKPIYLGASSPRWKRAEVMAALDANSNA